MTFRNNGIYRFLRTTSLVFFCVFFLSSCSTKLAYSFLDWAMLWYIESYVNLDRDQKKFTKQAIDEFHQWHRKTQLTRYADYIEGLKTRLESPSTRESIHAETDEVQLLIDASFNKIIPSLVDLCQMLSQEQIEEIKQNLQKERKDYRKKHIDTTDKKRHKLRINELKDYLGPFFGRFTTEQKQWLQTWSESLLPYEELTLKQQEIWEDTFTEAMKTRDNETKLEADLRELVLYETDNWNPELQERLDENQRLTYELIAKLINTRTEKQKIRFNNKLDDYHDVFWELANEK